MKAIATSVLLLLLAGAQQSAPPPPPIVVRGACPFECCQLGEWGTYDSIPAYDRERQSGRPAFWLLPKQRFVADSANLHTLAYGVIRFRRSARVGEVRSEDESDSIETPADSARRDSLRIPFAAGDSLLLLGHAAEEGEEVWARGRMMLVGWFWENSPAHARSDDVAVLERPLVQEWWVRVSAQGRHGWIEAFRPKIAGSDGCSGIPMP